MRTTVRLSLFVSLIMVLTGCRSKVPQPVKTTLPLMPTRAVSPLPETPLSASPTPENTPLPERVNSRLITPMNAADVTQLARLGQGMVNGAPFYSMDGELLVIPTSIGIDFYEAKSLHKVASIPHLTDGEFTLRPVDPRLVALSPGRDLLVANLYTFAFSPRGDFQEGSMQQMLYMWDLSNGSVVWKRPVGLDTFLVDLAFSPDGRSLAVGFGAGTVQLWNAISGEDLFSFKGSELEFSPDGSLMVTMPSGFYDDDFVYIYNTVDGQLLRQWEGQRAIFSPGGMLAIENNGAVRVMNIDKKIALKAFNGKSVAFSADGQSLALLDRDLIRLYRVADGSLLQVMEGSFKTITKMQFAPDGQTLAVVGEVPMCPNCLTEPQAALWRISDGTRVDLEIQDPRGLTYAPHEGHLVIWAVDSLHILNPQDASTITVFDEYATSVDGIAFSPDEHTLAANSGQPHLIVRLWQVEGSRLEKVFEDPMNPGYDYSKVVFSPDGKILWAQGSFWQTDDGERLTHLEDRLHEGGPPYFPASVSFSPDGKTMAIGYLEGHLQLWDLEKQELFRKLEGYQGAVVDLAFSSDGKTLAAIYDYPDYTIQLWKIPEGERLLSIQGTEWKHEFSQVLFSPDGQTLVSVAKNEDGMDLGTVELWRASDGKRLDQLDVIGVMIAAVSKDGEVIATGSYDHRVHLWRASDGKLLKVLNHHGDYITDLAFSPSGEWLASSSYDGTVILWGVPSGP